MVSIGCHCIGFVFAIDIVCGRDCGWSIALVLIYVRAVTATSQVYEDATSDAQSARAVLARSWHHPLCEYQYVRSRRSLGAG